MTLRNSWKKDHLHRARGLRASAAALAALTLLASAACGRDETTAPEPPNVDGTVTLDASKGWVYYSLDRQATVTPADPAASTDWDIAFNASSVMLNGGKAGAGNVSGYCLCQNSATNPEPATILAYTAASELPDFEAVKKSAIPAAGSFITDDLTPAVGDWHAGSGATATPVAGRAWLLRLRDGKTLAKLRVAAIQQPTSATPGR